MEKEMLIALAVDEGYLMPLTTTLRSITENNRPSWPIEFWVLHDGIREELKKEVLLSLPKGSARIVWFPIKMNIFQGFSAATMPHVSNITYSRILIPEIFPETVSRVLYLDADLLVLEDLGPLWQTDLR